MRSSPSVAATPARSRLLLFALASVVAVAVGFLLVTPKQAAVLIRYGGYYYIFAVFAAFGFYAVRLARSRQEVWRSWLRRPGWTGVALVAATGFVLWSDSYQHKILFDEYVLEATGYHMHVTKEVGTVIRAYDVDGTWLPVGTFLDKRPYFFTFLLSLVHDLTGFRLVNAFALNSALAAVFLALTYWFARELTGRAGALLAVALLATMPLLGQNASSANMEIHNLTMLVLVMCLALLYLRQPDEDRVALLCLGTVLLAQSRYESAIYAGPVAIIVLLGWRRVHRVVLPWVAVATPLLLIPYAWHNRVVSATPLLWQLGEGQKARFSLEYVVANLEGAFRFFFNVSGNLANSWYLSALGCVGLAWLIWRLLDWLGRRPPVALTAQVALIFGAGVAGNFALLQFYYWASLDDVIASRFALPATLMLALAAAVFASQLNPRWPVLRSAYCGLGLYLLLSGIPVLSHRFYTTQNLAMQEIDWERAFMLSRPAGQRLVISNKSTIPWVLWEMPSLIVQFACVRVDQLRYHMSQHTFHEIIVTQALRPTSAAGNFALDPEDALPPNFHLETLAEKRFGGRIDRLSRVISIDPAEPATSAPKVNPGPPAATSPAS